MQDSADTSQFHEEWMTSPGGHSFYTRLWLPDAPRAVVLFVHGFMEHGGRYEHVFPLWKARGIAVFAYDQRGFGRTCSDVEHKAPGASYGKTCGPDQVQDMEFFVRTVSQRFKNIPFFLMGFSMGGGRVLHFMTRKTPPPSLEAVNCISGVIAHAPHVLESIPVSKVIRCVGGIIAKVAPYTVFRTGAKATILSRNPDTNRDWEEDPLIKPQGTLRGLGDLLEDGEELAAKGYRNWPPNLPVIFLHGTRDPVTSPIASKKFYDDITAVDKTYISFPDAMHELHNEPDGVREKFHDSCLTWLDQHIPTAKPAES